MEQLKLFKIRLSLARAYLTGTESGKSFSRDIAERFASKAEETADLNLDPSMSLEERINWMESFN